MKIYKKTNHPWMCGFWNNSPIQIAMPPLLKTTPDKENEHFHAFHEYYCILKGRGKIKIEGKNINAKENTIIMVEPGEKHYIAWIDPQKGMKWIIIKEKSKPNDKNILRATAGKRRR